MRNYRQLDMEEVRNNPNMQWNKKLLSRNKNLTVKDIDTLILPNSKDIWSWSIISYSINISQIRNNPDKPWDKFALSFNETLTMEDLNTLVLPNSVGHWDWEIIPSKINIQEIINNPDKSWSRIGLKENKDITEKILEFFDAGLLKHLQKNIYTFKYHTDMSVKCEY